MASTWPAKNNYATGDVLTAANMNGVGDDLNDVYNFSGYAAGKNKIINGDFGIWQRGTSFSTPNAYTADRWYWVLPGTGTGTCTQQTFTPGTAPVAGYEGTYFARTTISTVGSSSYYQFQQRIEDVRTFAGQTVTISFWAKLNSGAVSGPYVRLNQDFGSGGSTKVAGTSNGFTLTSSWQRFTFTTSVASISGKTIGTNSFLELDFVIPFSAIGAIDFWGVQVEAGSTVSIFQTATGNKQAELAACQRYYERRTVGGANYGVGIPIVWRSSTAGMASITFAAPKRTSPSVAFSNLYVTSGNTALTVSTWSTVYSAGSAAGYTSGNSDVNVASGATAGQAGYTVDTGAGTGYIEFSSEL